jgi:DNA-binding transcriptional regulator YbjK
MGRREQVLDAAITLLGERGVHGLTHRAIDTSAGLPAGSTTNYFSTRDKLLDAVVERHAERERANFDELAGAVVPTTTADLGRALARYALDATGPHRTFTLARYAILVEAAVRPQLQECLRTTGQRITLWYSNWMRLLGSNEPVRDTRFVGNYITGLILHQLSYPNPDFDPEPDITAILEAVLKR